MNKFDNSHPNTKVTPYEAANGVPKSLDRRGEKVTTVTAVRASEPAAQTSVGRGVNKDTTKAKTAPVKAAAAKPAAKAAKAPTAPREKKVFGFDAAKEATAVRAGSKIAAAIDLLSRKSGVTASDLTAALSKTGAAVKEGELNGWLSYDVRGKGYGVRSEVNKNGVVTYFLSLPSGMSAPHAHKTPDAPKPAAAKAAKPAAKAAPAKKAGAAKK